MNFRIIDDIELEYRLQVFKLPLRLKELRLEKGFTMVKMAELLGLPYYIYVSYERGKNKMPIELILKTADTFDVSLDYLFVRTGQRERPPKYIDDE